jgi:hypothetical protein
MVMLAETNYLSRKYFRMKSLCELLFEDLKDLQQGSFSLMITSTATFLIVFGWFMTSATAQKLIKESMKVIQIVSAGLIITFLALVYIQWRLWSTSQEVSQLMWDASFPYGRKFYDHRIIHGVTVSIMEFVQLALIVLFIVAMVHIYKKEQKLSENEIEETEKVE